MNKRKVDELIPRAYIKLKESEIVQKDGTICSEYRGYIDTFGAAVAMGSIISAIAFFMEEDKGNQDRTKLLITMYNTIKDTNLRKTDTDWKEQIKEYVLKDERKAKEELVNAAVAIKLAMNLYNIIKKKESPNQSENEGDQS